MDDTDLQTDNGFHSDGVNSQTGGVSTSGRIDGIIDEPHNFHSTGSSST